MTAASLLLLTLALAAAAYLLFSRWFVPREVRINDRDITANGSQDSLRKAYHAYRNKVRAGYLAGLAVLANVPLAWVGWLPALLGVAALGVLLAAYFARYFTPLLNLARVAGGRTDLSEWHASFDSASWPDAAVAKEARLYPGDTISKQLYANVLLQRLLTRTWRYGRLGYGVLTLGLTLLVLL